MPAAVYKGDHTITVEEVPIPSVSSSQVLLQVSHCGICGTDLHMMLEDWGTPGTVGGHEYSGVVAAVGSSVRDWAPGDRAVGGPGPGCSRCRQCLAGQTHLCSDRAAGRGTTVSGAYAAYKVVDADCLFRVPDALDLRRAALTEPVAVALRGVRRAGAQPGDRVLVTGAGPIGLLTAAVLAAGAVTDITVSEPNATRRHLAEKMGVPTTVSPEDLQTPASALDLVAAPYQCAFECSGRADAMEAGLANLDRGGTLVLSGTGMNRPRLDSNRVIVHELVVTGTLEYTPHDYHAALDLLTEGRLPIDVLIAPEDLPLTRLQWAMEQLMAGELAGKVIVAPHA
jgi:(R,R)-butanediol dehydrogenase / meso-butanediol dehydrogenase / diacetyl reductase